MYELTKPDYLKMSLRQHSQIAIVAFMIAVAMAVGMIVGGAAMLIVATTDIEFKGTDSWQEDEETYEYDYSYYLEEFPDSEIGKSNSEPKRKVTLCPSTITLYDDNGCPLPSVYAVDYD